MVVEEALAVVEDDVGVVPGGEEGEERSRIKTYAPLIILNLCQKNCDKVFIIHFILYSGSQ